MWVKRSRLCTVLFHYEIVIFLLCTMAIAFRILNHHQGDETMQFKIYGYDHDGMDNEWEFLGEYDNEDVACAMADKFGDDYQEVIVEDDHMSLEEPDHVIHRA